MTGAADVLGQLSFGAGEVAGWPGGPVLPRDELDPVSRSVLEAVPARTGWGPARIAVSAGVDFDTVMRCLGQLAAGGYVERSARGWRVRPLWLIPGNPARFRAGFLPSAGESLMLGQWQARSNRSMT